MEALGSWVTKLQDVDSYLILDTTQAKFTQYRALGKSVLAVGFSKHVSSEARLENRPSDRECRARLSRMMKLRPSTARKVTGLSL